MNKLVILIIILVLLIICFIVFKINEKSTYRAETNPTDTQLITFYSTLINSVSSNYNTYNTNQKLSGITTLSNGSSLKSNSKCNYLRTNDGNYRLYLDKPTGPILGVYYAGLKIWNYAYNSSINITSIFKASSISYSELVVENNGVTFKDNTGTTFFKFFDFNPTSSSINLELKLYNGDNAGPNTAVLYIQAATLTTIFDNRFGTRNLILWEPVNNRSLLVSGGDNISSFNENSQLTGTNKLYKYDDKSNFVYINNSSIRHLPNSTLLYEATSLARYTGQYINYILRVTAIGGVQFLSTDANTVIDTLRSSNISSGKAPYFLEINNDYVLQIRDILGNRGILDDVPRSSLRDGESLWANGNRLYSTAREFSFHLERGIGANAINIYMVVTKDPIESYFKIIWKSKAIPTTTTSTRVRIIVQKNRSGGLMLEELDSSNNQKSFKWIAETKEETDSLEIDTSGYLRIYNSYRFIVWPTESIPQHFSTDDNKGAINVNFIVLANTANFANTRMKYFVSADKPGDSTVIVWPTEGNIAQGGATTKILLRRGKSILFGFDADQVGGGNPSDTIAQYNDDTNKSNVDLQFLAPNGIRYYKTMSDNGHFRYLRINNGPSSLQLLEAENDNNIQPPFRYEIDITNIKYMQNIGGYYNTMFLSDHIQDTSVPLTLNIMVFAFHSANCVEDKSNPSSSYYWCRFLDNGVPITKSPYHTNDRNRPDRVALFALDLIDGFNPDSKTFGDLSAANYSESYNIAIRSDVREYTWFPYFPNFSSSYMGFTPAFLYPDYPYFKFDLNNRPPF